MLSTTPLLMSRMIVCGVAVFGSISVCAEVYLCENESGEISLSNIDSQKKCKKMKLQPKPKYPPSYVQDVNNIQKNQYISSDLTKGSTTALPSSSEASAERKRIVLEELGLERRRLETVLSQVATAGIRTDSDAERQKFIASAKRKESLHRSNIELLEKEFSRLE